MTSGPESSQPESSRPEASQPDAGQPASGQPASGQPEPTQPFGSAPGVSGDPGQPGPGGYLPPPTTAMPPPSGAMPPPPAPGAAYGAPAYAYGVSPQTPYGVHPGSGIPYSDKQKLIAGLLQIFLGGFGIGRFYIGDTRTGVLQIVVTVFTCGIGSLWGLIDGILMLVNDQTLDANGYVLRP